MRNIIACLLIVACLLAVLAGIHHQVEAKSTILPPQINVSIKPSNHKTAYFSPTYIYCDVKINQLCNIKFTNKTSKPITLYIWSTFLATLKPNASVIHGFPYGDWSNGPDEHPTWEVNMSSAECWIFITQIAPSAPTIATPTPTPMS